MARRGSKTVEARNTFNRGMNQDTAISLYDKEKFFEAVNARVTTDETSLATGSLSSIKGNKFDFELPDVGGVWRLRILDTYIDANLDGSSKTFNMTVNSTTQAISYATTESQFFYETLAGYINGGNFGSNIVAQYDTRTLVIYTNDYSTLTVSSTETGIQLEQLVVNATNLEVIGSTSLRDSLILLTTSNQVQGSGQIWEVTYDSVDNPAFRLVRNMNDAFSINHPIEVVSRYEIEGVRKIYWTDDWNQIRFLNIDSDSAYIDSIDLVPSTEFDQPIPQSIDQSGGSLITSLYAASYRLKTLGGSETSFAKFSPLVRISAESESGDWFDYVGSVANAATTKAITFKIENLDPQFEFIDILIAKYDGTINYYLIQEDFSLNGASEYEFTLSSVSSSQLQDEAEILIPPATFLRAKTLTIKDNRLLPGNVRDIDLTLDDYDSTAIRYDSGGNTDGYENTSDKRNKYNKDSTRALTSAQQQKFQSDGLTLGGSGTNISFKFITEDFVMDSKGGTTNHPSIYWPASNNVGNDHARTEVASGLADKTLNGRTLPMGSLYKNYKNPLLEAWFKGYMRSEVYRFGIVFFDRKGRQSAVKWISDIRMPDQAEVPAFSQNSTEFLGHALGLEFDVTVTNDMKDKFSGFSIVRSPRGTNNRTILGQSIMGDMETSPVIYSDGSDGFSDNSSGFKVFFRTDRLLQYGRNMTHYWKTLNTPEFNFGGAYDIDNTKIRPVVSLAASHIGLMDKNDVSAILATGSDHGMFAKYYSPYSYFASNSTSDNPITLSQTVDNYINTSFGSRISQDPMFQSGSIEGFMNYSGMRNPNSYGNQTVNTAFFGTNELGLRSKGTECQVIKTGSWYNTYTTNSRVLSSSNMSVGGAWSGVPVLSGDGGPGPVLAQALIPTVGRRLIVNIYKEIANQYGGDSESAINNTNYITTNHYTPFKTSDSGNTYTVQVYGGDTYICAYDESHFMANHHAGAAAGNPYFPDNGEAYMSSQIYPIETTLNMDIRENRHFANIGFSTPGSTAGNVIDWFLPNDTYVYQGYQNLDQNGIVYESLDEFRNNAIEFDNRVYASDVKVNGEPGDSWTSYKVNNFLDVDGNLGPINKLITFKDRVLFFQDRGFGAIAVNPRTAVLGSDNVSIQLGTGDVLYDFTNYSTTIGTKHQWSVFQSPSAVYWYNILDKKAYRYYGQGAQDLVDIKGMHSFFNSNVDQTLISRDNPLTNSGIHGTYDFINKEAIFTFLGAKTDSTPDSQIGVGNAQASDLNLSSSRLGSGAIAAPVDADAADINIDDISGFTIAYSETVDAWTSFYDFKPTHYINGQNRLLTPKQSSRARIYRHNIGKYLNFYDTYYPMKLSIVVSPYANETKVFDNISFHTLAKNNDGFGVDQSTFERFSCYTEYQHSGNITLTPESTIKREEREWQLDVPRNIMIANQADINIFDSNNWDNNKTYLDRMRDKYLIQNYEKDGSTNNDQFVVNYINTRFRVSAR